MDDNSFKPNNFPENQSPTPPESLPEPTLNQPLPPNQPATPQSTPPSAQPIQEQPAFQQPIQPNPWPQDATQSSPQPSSQPSEQFVQNNPALTGTMPSPKKTKIIPIVVISAIIVIALVVVLVFMLMPRSSKIGIGNIRNYCNNHNLTIKETDDSQYVNGTTLECSSTNVDSALMISYIHFKEPGDSQSISQITSMVVTYDDGLELENSNEYKKYYISYGRSGDGYCICNDNGCLALVATSDNDARRALLEIGYPDRNWPTEENKSSELKMQNDTIRRNDMSRLDTSLVQYQVNHQNQSDNLPSKGSWNSRTQTDGTEPNTFPSSCTSNSACAFIRDYMNTGAYYDNTNSFEDPDGVTYSLIITENYAGQSKGSTPVYDNLPGINGTLSLNENNTYTITDASGNAFDDYLIYVIPGGKCDGSGVVPSTKRHFAILYHLESAGVYCIDDQ